MVLLALTTEWPLRWPRDASQSHHSDSELYKAIRNTNVTSYVCVCADLAASVRSRWERGLAVQDFIPWLSCPCSAKIHTRASVLFLLGWFLWSKGYTGQKWTERLLHSSIWFILMELHLPSSYVKTTEVIPVADEGFFLPFKGWRQNRHDKATVNSFRQNPLPMRSWWCYDIEGKRPFPTWSPAVHWHHLFLKVVLASAVQLFWSILFTLKLSQKLEAL